MPHTYSALLEPEPEGGFTVSFPEVGFGATYGATWDEALHEAQDMLEEAVLGLIAHDEEVPEPVSQFDAAVADGAHRVAITLPALTAAKLELYRSMRQAAIDKVELGKRLGWPTNKIEHLLDGYHTVRLEQLETALAALGKRLVVTSEPA
jgi:antitoxin HicB